MLYFTYCQRLLLTLTLRSGHYIKWNFLIKKKNALYNSMFFEHYVLPKLQKTITTLIIKKPFSYLYTMPFTKVISLSMHITEVLLSNALINSNGL